MVVGGRGLAEAINGVLEATFLLPEQAAALATRPRVGCGELTLSYLAEYLVLRRAHRDGLEPLGRKLRRR